MTVELAAHGMRVSAVNPGYARTDMTIQCFPPKQQAFLTKGFIRAPLRRNVEPSEVANAFTFRASRVASGITGVSPVFDGGLTAILLIMETFFGASGS